ncbi:MAG: PAS domain S-box protein [Thermodesulfovibrionales bacterium]
MRFERYRIPLKISLIYLLVGGVWILFSDLLISALFKDLSFLMRLEIFKGWFFIAVTAVILYIVILRNIDAIRTSEEALRGSEERFRQLVQRITDYEIFMLDPSGHIVSWNIGAEKSKGYRPDEVLGKHHSLFFTAEDVRRGLPEMELKIAGDKGRFEDEGWRVRKDGSLFWASVVITTLRDEEGYLRGFSKVIRDITERKRAEETLRDSEEKYRIIAETASDAIITIDESGVVVFANSAIEKIFGYSPEEITGKPLTILMPERLREAHLAGMRQFLTTGKRDVKWEAMELPGLHKDGREIPLEISYGVFIREGKSFFTGIVRDIAERKLAEKEKEYKDMLERFNQELETLVAERTMSLMALKLADRVRTPASIIGLLGKKMLGRGDAPDRTREAVETVVAEAEKLDVIVKEFQALLTKQKSVFGYEDINEIVRDMLAIIEREAVSKHVEFRVRLAAGPLKINAQKDLLKMAVFNILRNAVESSREGCCITVETAGDGDHIYLSVSDTGRGIPGDLLDKIFDPVYSGDFYRFGIGLPLIKQIISEHLGEIRVESETDKGTTFKISFPVRWKEGSARPA